MKITIIFLSMFFLAGCFFVFKDEEQVKIYGGPKEYVSDILNKLEGPEVKKPEPQEETPVVDTGVVEPIRMK